MPPCFRGRADLGERSGEVVAAERIRHQRVEGISIAAVAVRHQLESGGDTRVRRGNMAGKSKKAVLSER